MEVPGTAGQGLAQRLQVDICAAQRRQANGLGFEDMAGFTGLLGGAAGHCLHRLQWVLGRAQVAAVALANFHQATERQHAHGLTHGVAADAQLQGKLWLGRQALTDLPIAQHDAFAHALYRQLHQGALGQLCIHATQPIIRRIDAAYWIAGKEVNHLVFLPVVGMPLCCNAHCVLSRMRPHATGKFAVIAVPGPAAGL
ncbi:hypothetical protein D3C80_1003440 [compost metagenome]